MIDPITQYLLEYSYKKEHGHDKAEINSIDWFFHNYEHGYNHCTGSEKHPYDIEHYMLQGKLIHIINNKKGKGHGINKQSQWFKFNKEIKKGWYHLEKGIEQKN